MQSIVSLTGFALVGGPASQDHHKAIEALSKLNVPCLVALPLVFQSTEEWLGSSLGLHPIRGTHHPNPERRDSTTSPHQVADAAGNEVSAEIHSFSLDVVDDKFCGMIDACLWFIVSMDPLHALFMPKNVSLSFCGSKNSMTFIVVLGFFTLLTNFSPPHSGPFFISNTFQMYAY